MRMAGRVAGLWNGYWFRPGPLLDLGALRIIAVGTQVGLMLFDPRYGAESLAFAARIPDSYYHALPLLGAILSLFGGHPPSLGFMQALHVGVTLVGVMALVGFLTNASLALFAAGCLFIQLWASSHGDIHHPEAVMMVALCVLAASKAGRALSVDAWLSRRAGKAPGDGTEDGLSAEARWPILLLQWFFVLMYASAAYAKVRYGQGEWANGFTLQYYLAQDGLRWGSAIGVWLSQFHLFILLTQWGILLFQATFFLSMAYPPLKWAYVPAGMAMHVGIYILLRAPFLQWAMLYAIFIPWSRAFAMLRTRPGGLAARQRLAAGGP